MRKFLVIVAVLAVIAAGVALWWSQPLLALRNLKHALMARDPDRVAALVDFDAVRINVTKHTDHKIDRSNQDKFLGGLRDSVEKSLADSKIEELATPEGFIHLVCDKKPDGSIDTSPQPRSKPCVLNGQVKKARYKDSDHFDVGVHRKAGGDFTISLEHSADGWKASDLFDGISN